MNWAAALAWGISIVFSFSLVFAGIIHRNLILLPTFVLTMVLYLVFAGMAGAKEKYPEEEKEEEEYRKELQKYANEMHQDDVPFTVTGMAKVLRIGAFLILGVFLVCGILCGMGKVDLEMYKILSLVLSLAYFGCNGTALVISLKKTTIA